MNIPLAVGELGHNNPEYEIQPAMHVDSSEDNKAYQLSDAYNYWHLPGEKPEFYENLGIKQFKKIRSRAGDLDVGFKPDVIADEAPEETRIRRIAAFADETKKSELSHVVGSVVLGAEYTYFTAVNGHSPIFDIVMGSLQVAVNAYPIMHQRYNRLRCHRLLGKISNTDVNSSKLV